MTYHALAVRQPFASLIAIGKKTIEWRKKPFKYRGELLICASASPKKKTPTGDYLPTGAAICVVDMVDCRPFTKADLAPACCLDYLEHLYGPPEGFAWVLENPREIELIPGKWIVAPWPWKGPEPVFKAGLHASLGFVPENLTVNGGLKTA